MILNRFGAWCSKRLSSLSANNLFHHDLSQFKSQSFKSLSKSSSAILLSAFVLAGCGGVDPDQPAGEFEAPVREWQLVFSDEFDGTALDSSKWNIDLGDGCPDLCGWGNAELQQYAADNVSVADGLLRIEGRDEGAGVYTSGRINTKGKFDFNYGRVEVRAKIPSGQGIWPAIWLLHSDPTIYGGWPQSGEIDMMEGFNFAVNDNFNIASTVHSGLPIPYNTYTTGTTDLASDADLEFHDYVLEWERGRLRFFVDGVHYQTIDQDNWFSYYPADEEGLYDPYGPYTLGLDDAPFDQLFHIILNFAIGGNPVGSPDMNTLFPQALEVDYVRVYECANSNPETRRGCGTVDPNVEPLTMHSGAPLANATTANPYLEVLDLYSDGPEVITVSIGNDSSTNTLEVNGFTGDNATVVNNPNVIDPDDETNTVWHVSVAGDVANVYLQSQDLTEDELLDTGFDFSTSDLVGEIVFDMKINSATSGTQLIVKLDSGFPNVGQVTIPESEWAVGEWKTYSIKFKDIVANPGFVDCCGGQGVDLSNVVNPFVFEVVPAENGSADVFIDDIYISNACYVVGGCKAANRLKALPDLIVFDNEVNIGTWDVGIAAADSGSGFANYTDGTNTANKANWQVITDTDPDRGEVIDVTFNDSGEFGVWFIQSTTGVNMNAYAAGAVEFDIIVDDYGNNTTGMTMKIDCFFPCTSGDKNLGVIADGVWETITVPVSQLTASGLDLSTVNTGVVIFPTNQSGTIRFRLDNIKWVSTTDAPPLQQIDLPVTFDDSTVDYTVTDFGGNGSIIDVDPTDSANNVMRTVKGDGSEVWAGTIIGTDSGFATAVPLTASETTMSMRVYSPLAGIPVRLKLENLDDSNISVETEALTTTSDAWETIVFDFSNTVVDTPAFDPAQTYQKAIVFFNFGTAGTGEAYYWDNVSFGDDGGLSQLDLPITFDETATNFDAAVFGGTALTLDVADPENAGNKVAQLDKPIGAELWSGVVFGADNGLANNIPFSASETKLSMRVYSPDAGIPVRMKVENFNDGNISVETETLTTVANGWETLTFDFSNNVSGTPALDLAQAYRKVAVFFNFGTDGTTAGDKTYYFENIQFGVPLDLPVTFDNADINYQFIDFGGNSTTTAADPVDAANTVAATTKGAGSEVWAGSIVGDDNGFANPIPFEAGSTSMQLRVYSPAAGIPVRLKVENLADGAIAVETEATTTVANSWETLTFNFTNNVSGTPAIDVNQSYQKAVVFFDFGTSGDDSVYYWDDLTFGGVK
ncbi:MAG: family 16 glycosylhydrolase [Gammaproteobacteria bacterium]|nr:family 16 glycosylhydrolase [Gammaproteobacteria bacterium]